MPTQSNFRPVAALRHQAVTLTCAFALLSFTSMAQDNPSSPPDGWTKYGQPVTISTTQDGLPNRYTCGSCVRTANQDLTTDLNLSIYKNAVPTQDGFDYYLVTGPFRHAINSSDGTNTNHNNWISEGIFGKEMGLTISANGARLWDSGPSSTVGSNSTGFNVGGNISASSGSGVSFGYSQTFTTPDVSFSTSADSQQVKIKTTLPGITSSRTNAAGASNSGTSYQAAAIFQVAQGQGLKLTVTSSAEWSYVAPRPTVLQTYLSWASATYEADFTEKQIISDASGYCMTVDGSGVSDGRLVVLTPCNGAPSQKWSYTAYSQLRSSASETPFCLDADNLATDAKLVIRACDKLRASQKFQAAKQWNYSRNLRSQFDVTLSIYWINFTFPGQICALSSPYSFSNSPTTCGVLPTQIPASNIGSAASDNLVLLTAGGGLAVTSGVTANYGDHFVLQAPQAGASDTGITADGIKMARNHFFSVR